MLREQKGLKKEYYIQDYVVFDLETTGIFTNSDQIIEISALRVRKGRVEKSFSSLVNPGRPIPYGASRVNHIYDSTVKNAPRIEEVLLRFIEFIGEDVLVGHNIHRFDMNFIYRDSFALFGKYPGNDYIDTLPLAKKLLPVLKQHSLTGLADYYGISTEGAHRALKDCYMNQEIFERLGRIGEKESSQIAALQCPKCKKVLKLRESIYGKFWGCEGYPSCRYTRNFDAEKDR
ncbi:MAG: exonuclease domain-containing protein [Johnsonella sp.]|nr:exonuclease domain-containing protein [Johnsonella sp.]